MTLQSLIDALAKLQALHGPDSEVIFCDKSEQWEDPVGEVWFDQKKKQVVLS